MHLNVFATAVLLVPAAAGAHGDTSLPHAFLNRDLPVHLGIAIAAASYGYGVTRLWRYRLGHGVRAWQVACFAAGLAALALALLGPLDALAAYSLAAHMGQHMLLIAVSPLLLVLGAPPAPLAVFGPMRRLLAALAHRPWNRLTQPATAFTLHAATVWIWHAPALFEAAIHSDGLHALEHATMFGTGFFFWWSLLYSGRARASGYGISVILALSTIMHTGLLGALLTFAPRALYPVYAEGANPLGLAPLADQQLAGLLMWVPGGFLYLIAGLALAGAWLRRAERRSASSLS